MLTTKPQYLRRSKHIPKNKYAIPLPNRNALAKAPLAKPFVKGGKKAPKLGQK